MEVLTMKFFIFSLAGLLGMDFYNSAMLYSFA